MDVKLKHRIEIFLLGVLILLHVADFFKILPEDLAYTKKILSWILMGYLFIHVSLSYVLFGHKKRGFDIGIVLTYFLFSLKSFTRYADVAADEAFLFRPFLSFLSANAIQIEKFGFYIGGISLLLISLYMALKFRIDEPSLMATFHEKGLPTGIISIILRFFSIFLVLIAFLRIVFNLAVEWLALVLDAPLVMAGLLFYFSLLPLKRLNDYDPDHFIHKIGTFGEDFYRRFIGMFHYKQTLFLGVMGLLALHPLTDAGVFIISSIVNLKDVFYFGHLGSGHIPLVSLLISDLPFANGFLGSASLIIVYLLNLIALLFLLLLPVFIWKRFFSGKLLHVSRTMLSLIFPSILCFLLMPAFYIKKITVKSLVGVDISTQSILNSTSLIDYLIQNRITAVMIVAAISLLFIFLVWILEYSKIIEKDVFIVAVLVGLIFFGFYVFYYFVSYFGFYIAAITNLFRSNELFIGIHFVLFAIIHALFYVGGYLFFLYEVFKRHFFRWFSY